MEEKHTLILLAALWPESWNKGDALIVLGKAREGRCVSRSDSGI